MNFAMHVAIFAVFNSGFWFFHNLKSTSWEWLPWLTSGWVVVLLLHLIYISALADYSEQTPQDTASKSTLS
jgi:hypothetical protein